MPMAGPGKLAALLKSDMELWGPRPFAMRQLTAGRVRFGSFWSVQLCSRRVRFNPDRGRRIGPFVLMVALLTQRAH
jgi:hypothetical protein